jgi:hypothetical protein
MMYGGCLKAKLCPHLKMVTEVKSEVEEDFSGTTLWFLGLLESACLEYVLS